MALSACGGGGGSEAPAPQPPLPEVTNQSGQPARAVDVNENFSALTSAIDQNATDIAANTAKANTNSTRNQDLDSRLSSVESQACTSDGGFSDGAHSVNYEPIVANVGKLVVVEGVPYAIAKIPFVEYASGTGYAIFLPVGTNAFSIRTRHASVDTRCTNFTISDFPATLDLEEIRFIGKTNASSASSNSTINVNITIKISETLVFLSIPTTIVHETGFGGSANPAIHDLTALDAGTMTHPGAAIAAADQLIDYIRIEVLPGA